MSPTSSLERRYSLRSDQILSTERRVALSQVHTDQIVASVREHFSAWRAAIESREDRVVILGHSSNVQQAIANIMRRNAWSPLVEQAVQTILGASSHFNISMGKTFATMQPIVRPLETNPVAIEQDTWSRTDDEDELG